MGINYSRGNQLFINDPRVFWQIGSNKIPIYPPDARHRFTPMPAEPVGNIMKVAAQFAEIDGKLDAFHLFAHGAMGFLQLGGDGLTKDNAKVFKPLRDKVRIIVIYGCTTGSDVTPGLINAQNYTLGGAVAAQTNAKVIVCRDIQYHGGVVGSTTGRGGVGFGDDGFEGPVYVCYPNGDTTTIYQSPTTGKAYIDLESYIFSNTSH